jgi:nitrite reductase (NADH) large subunit
MTEELIIIGNGMAGVRCIEEVLKQDSNEFNITVFGKEPTPGYDRIQLSTVLQGSTSMEDIILNPKEWYEKNGVTLHIGETVSHINTETRIVETDKGRRTAYDKLVVATGSNPFILPLPGVDKEGVITFRDMKDCQTMIETSKTYKKAVVIGGGLLGLEAARGLLNLNMEVSVVHLMDSLMERQLDSTASTMLRKKLEQQGMNFLMEAQTAEILGNERVTGVQFKSGQTIQADLVVMAIGIRPNIKLAEESNLDTNRGIMVDDYLKTSADNVYAVGECAEHRGMVYGLVAPLYEQAAAMAKHLCGNHADPYQGSVLSTKLKVSGVDVFSAGEFQDSEKSKAVRVHDETEDTYKKIIIQDNKIAGTVMFGDTSDSSRIFTFMRTAADVGDMKKVALLEPDDGDHTEADLVAAMPEDEIICGCNGVSKETITQAIRDQELTSVEEIKNCTNASRSCGGCKPLVGQLLENVLGDDYDPAAQKEPVCACTDLSRDEVVADIQEKGLQTIKEVYHVLDWNNKEGCSKCRPALNYYLSMIYPEDYEDERHSRFVNERMHANIQNDGSYSIVPRMYGGVTDPNQLRKIADVSEKYDIKMLKVTGGQRIDMLGAKKGDLPKIWEDLDMPSGYAYAKAVRTVKTCVGEDFCRFGTQDSIGLGVKIEKKFERLDTPHKIKMAVSACPRSCAESGFKDIGIIGVDGGWEIYVGGNGGINVKGGEFLCTAATEEEILVIIGAYLQHYRETANYAERTSAWLERIGLDPIKNVIEDEQKRKELYNRIEIALAATQDPWKEAVENKEVRETFEKVLTN